MIGVSDCELYGEDGGDYGSLGGGLGLSDKRFFLKLVVISVLLVAEKMDKEWKSDVSFL